MQWESRGIFGRNIVQGNATCLPVLDPLPPPIDQVSKECTEISESDAAGASNPLRQRVTCPWHPGNRAYARTKCLELLCNTARMPVVLAYAGICSGP